MTRANKWVFLQALPTVLGLGLAWIGFNLTKNEKKLFLRQLELKEALKSKSSKTRKKLILGK